MCAAARRPSSDPSSSRKIALACERNLAFLAIAGEHRPDFRTVSDFRKIHLEAFADVFIGVLQLASATGMIKLGSVSIDRAGGEFRRC